MWPWQQLSLGRMSHVTVGRGLWARGRAASIVSGAVISSASVAGDTILHCCCSYLNRAAVTINVISALSVVVTLLLSISLSFLLVPFVATLLLSILQYCCHFCWFCFWWHYCNNITVISAGSVPDNITIVSFCCCDTAAVNIAVISAGSIYGDITVVNITILLSFLLVLFLVYYNIVVISACSVSGNITIVNITIFSVISAGFVSGDITVVNITILLLFLLTLLLSILQSLLQLLRMWQLLSPLLSFLLCVVAVTIVESILDKCFCLENLMVSLDYVMN